MFEWTRLPSNTIQSPMNDHHLGRRAGQQQRHGLEHRVVDFLAEVDPPRLEDVHLRRVVVHGMEPPEPVEGVQAAVEPVVREGPDPEPERDLRGERPGARPQIRDAHRAAQLREPGERGDAQRTADRPRQRREQDPVPRVVPRLAIAEEVHLRVARQHLLDRQDHEEVRDGERGSEARRIEPAREPPGGERDEASHQDGKAEPGQEAADLHASPFE